MFNIDYSSIFQNLPPELTVFLVAMIPIAELRVSIPLAVGTYNLSYASAFLFSFLGNIIPVFFILWFLKPVSNFLMKSSRFFEKFFNWLFERTRQRFIKKSQKFGVMIALVLFVAIPLPITGAWTGSVAAFLFNIPFKKALLAISIGVMIAGIIVSSVSFGFLSFR